MICTVPTLLDLGISAPPTMTSSLCLSAHQGSTDPMVASQPALLVLQASTVELALCHAVSAPSTSFNLGQAITTTKCPPLPIAIPAGSMLHMLEELIVEAQLMDPLDKPTASAG